MHRLATVDVRADGSWTANGLSVREGFASIPELDVSVRQFGVSRRLALLHSAAPGAKTEVRDPWLGGAPWKLRVLFGDDTPIGPLDTLTLEVQGSPDLIIRAERNGEGSYFVPHAPLGQWDFSIAPEGSSQRSPFMGTISHDGRPVVIRCDGYRSLSGSVLTGVDLEFVDLTVYLLTPEQDSRGISPVKFMWNAPSTHVKVGGGFRVGWLRPGDPLTAVVYDALSQQTIGRAPVPPSPKILSIPVTDPAIAPNSGRLTGDEWKAFLRDNR